MATVRKSLADIQRDDPRFSEEQRRRMGEYHEEHAADDADVPFATDDQLKKAELARFLRQLRTKLALTQEQFAERYALPVATVRDWEQGRREPDAPARALIRIIEKEPDAAARALRAA